MDSVSLSHHDTYFCAETQLPMGWCGEVGPRAHDRITALTEGPRRALPLALCADTSAPPSGLSPDPDSASALPPGVQTPDL